MSPSPPTNNPGDSSPIHVETLRQFTLPHTSCNLAPNLPDRILCQFRPRMILSSRKALRISLDCHPSRTRVRSSSALLGHIPHIVLLSSQEQMARIHTQRVVAVMQNLKTFGDCSVYQFPNHPMSTSPDKFAITAHPDVKGTVSPCLPSEPIPTRTPATPVNLLPESLQGTLIHQLPGLARSEAPSRPHSLAFHFFAHRPTTHGTPRARYGSAYAFFGPQGDTFSINTFGTHCACRSNAHGTSPPFFFPFFL